jgi:sugar-specific transcriptional regulator TrmB
MEKKSTKKIVPLLEKAGFSDKEIAIYLALLEIGKGTVSEIARKAGVGRTYGYTILDGLAAKGLASISGKEPKHEYIAESPRKLITLLEEELESKKQVASELKSILPELIAAHSVEDRPKVRFYEGIQGMQAVYEDTLSSNEPVIRGYLKYDELHNTLKQYFPGYYKRRATKELFGRAIATDTPLARERKKHDKEENREIRLIPKDKFDISPEIDIYDNKVMIVSWREKLGVIIESGEIADAMKKIFDLVWETRK